MRLGNRVRAGLRAIADGVFVLGLALLNLPVLMVWVAGLVLCPMPVLGTDVLFVAARVVRWRADLERQLGTRAGIPIGRPYHPAPDRRDLGTRRWLRWIITDPATWRDMAWLLPGALVAASLGLLIVVLVAYGAAGVGLLPLWLFIAGAWFGYGVFWPTANLTEAWLALPQGGAMLIVAFVAAPWLRSTTFRFERLFLAPTAAADLRLRVAHLTVSRSDAIDAQAAELRRI